MKKTRLPFSSLVREEDKKPKASHPAPHAQNAGHPQNRPAGRPKTREKTRSSKSSTYQYSKGGHGPSKGSMRGKSPFKTESKIPPPGEDVIRIIPLGGVEEVGRNMLLVESKDDIIVLDVGFHFIDEEEAMGADFTLPNFKYLEERKDKIRAVAITHGHLDHIGGIPFIMDRIGNPPIYGQNLTMLMIKKRQEEYPNKAPLTLHVVDEDTKIKFNQLSLGFFPVYHSIPDSMGVIVGTPDGNIIVSGDMKLEHEAGKPTPKEEKKWTGLGKQKNLLLIADSTNAEVPGFSISEKEVQKNIEEIIRTTNGRLIIGTFASQFDRMIKIVEICEKYNKKIVVEGRSMKNNVDIAKLAELMKPKPDTFIQAQDIDNYPPNRIVVIATGAQGEEFAALMRMATGKHKYIRLNAQDTVMFSSSVIPGNEVNIQKLKDHLYRHDLKLIHYGIAEIHSGGHARQEDLVWINKAVNPKFFMPGYGNHSMLRIHAQIIRERNNFPKENIVVPDNGTIVEITKGEKISVRKEKAPATMMVVDGLSVGDVQEVVMRDRVMLAQDGMFVIIALLDQKTGKLKKSPDLISRGFVYLKENQELLRQVRIIIKKLVEDAAARARTDNFDLIKAELGENVSKFLYQKTEKRPLVIPVILSV
ncbi:MAG TPA: ribonuclease J [Candidatus Paceibacterota bacterium]|jgi:ribonuclease J|nr:ribonuclease J [Candidatus Paceibacterota bacterium]